MILTTTVLKEHTLFNRNPTWHISFMLQIRHRGSSPFYTTQNMCVFYFGEKWRQAARSITSQAGCQHSTSKFQHLIPFVKCYNQPFQKPPFFFFFIQDFWRIKLGGFVPFQPTKARFHGFPEVSLKNTVLNHSKSSSYKMLYICIFFVLCPLITNYFSSSVSHGTIRLSQLFNIS